MSKPSQPDLSNFICLFVCFCLFTVILYLFVVILPFSVHHLAVLHVFDVFLPPWFPFYCTFSQVLPLRATGGGTHPDRLSSGRPNPDPSWCILGLYVKPTWQPPAPEHSLRSACLFWSLQQPVGPAPSPTCWGMWARTDPGGRTAPAERGSGPNCSPVCAKGEAGGWAAPSCWVEVWVYIRL